jgi:hypothetical protein
MVYAFARDGGVPFSKWLRSVGIHQTPGPAIIAVAALAIAFTVYTPVYSTITLVCAIFLYLSYVIPIGLGLLAYGRTWKTMGPWNLGVWFRPLAIAAILGCTVLVIIGMAPPNDRAFYILLATTTILVIVAQTRFGRIHLNSPSDTTK